MYAKFKYKNHRGEIADRVVKVESLDYLIEPGYGYEAGWFLSGTCQDKGERRSFALVNIVPDNPHQPNAFNHIVFTESAE